MCRGEDFQPEDQPVPLTKCQPPGLAGHLGANGLGTAAYRRGWEGGREGGQQGGPAASIDDEPKLELGHSDVTLQIQHSLNNLITTISYSQSLESASTEPAKAPACLFGRTRYHTTLLTPPPHDRTGAMPCPSLPCPSLPCLPPALPQTTFGENE